MMELITTHQAQHQANTIPGETGTTANAQPSAEKAQFLWGTSTSAFQIEGAAFQYGKTASIWDTFCHTPGCILQDEHADVACDHYHRLEEDVRLMRALNQDAYRFSLSWPRIFPDGTETPNPEGIAFYRHLLQLLQEAGIRPLVTLYHWDLPQWLDDRGGWLNRDTAHAFARFAAFCFNTFGDIVLDWTTLNEPWVAAFLGYWEGMHAPGHTDFHEALIAAHHLLLGHGLAVQAFRKGQHAGRIGITLNLNTIYAATDSPADQLAVQRYDGFLNRWFLDPLFLGGYPEDMVEWYRMHHVLPEFPDTDRAILAEPVDFLGINTYTAHTVASAESPMELQAKTVMTGRPVTAMDFEVYPEGLLQLLHRLHDRHPGLPLLITENGAAYADPPVEAGRIHDELRVAYLQAHVQVVRQALEEGIPLQGYMVWSLLDNFEWSFGYHRPFGLVQCAPDTLERIVKDSGYWYRDWIRAWRNPAAVSE